MSDRVIVYTAMTGGYDVLRPPRVAGEFVAFVDEAQSVTGWEQRVIRQTHMGNRKAARMYKALPHVWVSEADISIWVDANVTLLVEPQRLVDEWLGEGMIAVPAHPRVEKCAYEEARRCAIKAKADVDTLKRQTNAYTAEGFPRFFGLAETRCVIRRHTSDVMRFNDLWWQQMEQFTPRDQVSFPFAVWKTRVAVNYVEGWVPRHSWFEYHEHGE